MQSDSGENVVRLNGKHHISQCKLEFHTKKKQNFDQQPWNNRDAIQELRTTFDVSQLFNESFQRPLVFLARG